MKIAHTTESNCTESFFEFRTFVPAGFYSEYFLFEDWHFDTCTFSTNQSGNYEETKTEVEITEK